ncbi:MAG: hypothetical protein ACE5FB_08325, partial [Candidatus Binatia bacterium]
AMALAREGSTTAEWSCFSVVKPLDKLRAGPSAEPAPSLVEGLGTSPLDRPKQMSAEGQGLGIHFAASSMPR